MVIHRIYPDDGDREYFQNVGFQLNIEIADPLKRF
jgi:hypothetical protein